MKRFSGPRKPARFSESIHKQLNMYALAADATGVSMLRLVQPADAKVIYTAANIHIPPNSALSLDVKHDGINDFKFICRRASVVGTHGLRNSSAVLVVFGVGSGNQIYGQGRDVSALPAGVRIGPNGKLPGGYIMAWVGASDGINNAHCGFWAGDGKGVKHRYLGLRGRNRRSPGPANLAVRRAVRITVCFWLMRTEGLFGSTGRLAYPALDLMSSIRRCRIPGGRITMF
jgi:hypothetical protein